MSEIFESKSTWKGWFQRAQPGLNFGLSAFGSFLYLIGSIMFIPDTDLIVEGTYVFIFGSFIISLSQTWKLYRAGCCNEDESFQIKTMFVDAPAFGVDAGAGVGGVAYFIGSILFLPGVATYYAGAIFFIIGGTFFSVSGMCLVYRYFCITVQRSSFQTNSTSK